jgi:DNA-binding PadR family transcriptional regulator
VQGPGPQTLRNPSSGSLYLSMLRLEERGLIEAIASPPEERDERRRYYRLTRLGERVLAAEIERLSGLVGVARGAGIGGRRTPRSSEA